MDRHRLSVNNLVEPTSDELVNRAVAWGVAGVSAALALVTWYAPPSVQAAISVFVAGGGAATLTVGSRANRLASDRRNIEVVAEQAIRDGAYAGLTAQTTEAAREAFKPRTQQTVLATLKPRKLASENTDIIELMVNCGLHIIIASKTGSGKSTLLNAYISRLYQKHQDGEHTMFIIDPKTSSWLGLERYEGEDGSRIVNYTSNETPEKTLDYVRTVYDELISRKTERQRARELGKTPPTFPPIYFIFDEYSDTYGYMLKNAKKQAEQLASMMGSIASTGRSEGVFSVLAAQTHLCTEIGFSSPSRENFFILALGNQASGYQSIVRYTGDQYAFDEAQRKDLAEQWARLQADGLDRAYATNLTPLAPTVGRVPNLSWVDDVVLYSPSDDEDGDGGDGGSLVPAFSPDDVLRLQKDGYTAAQIVEALLGVKRSRSDRWKACLSAVEDVLARLAVPA